MDLKHYIESGILESYLLGEVSDQERREVECLSKIYPEIREELTQLESSLEDISLRLARPLPEGHKEKVMTAIAGLEQDSPETKAVSPATGRSYLSWMAAASILLAVFGGYQYLRESQINKELMETNEEIRERTAALQAEVSNDSVILAHLSNPETRLISLDASDKYEGEKALVFWNQSTRQTYVVMEDLSPAPEGLSYQLWAIVDGVPLDLGVHDPGRVLLAEVDFDAPQAFAITLETGGGNPQPNLEELVVIGNVQPAG